MSWVWEPSKTTSSTLAQAYIEGRWQDMTKHYINMHTEIEGYQLCSYPGIS